MPTFILICTDKPNALDLRLATREAHLAYIRSQADRISMAGPMLNDAGQPVGSVIFMDATEKTEVEAFAAADPYAQAGVFGEVVIRPFNVAIGKLG